MLSVFRNSFKQAKLKAGEQKELCKKVAFGTALFGISSCFFSRPSVKTEMPANTTEAHIHPAVLISIR